MKLLIVLVAMGVIGVIGAVEYSHAEIPPDQKTDTKNMWKERWNTCFEKKENLKAELNRLQDKINTKADTKNLWKERHATCFDKKENFKAELDNWKSSYNALEQEKSGLSTRVNSLESQFDTLQSNFNRLQSNFDNTQQRLSTYEGMYNTLETKYNTAQTTINERESTISQLQYKVDTKADTKNLWKERHATCFDKKENFKAELDNWKSSYNALEQEKADLLNKIKMLESQLGEN